MRLKWLLEPHFERPCMLPEFGVYTYNIVVYDRASQIICGEGPDF